MNNNVLRPTWYTKGTIECIDAIESAFSKKDTAAFCRINAFKYIWRSTPHKDNAEINVRKAIWFLERSIEEH